MPRSQRGMAMLVVLLTIAIMALLATTANQYGMQALARAESSQAFQQSKWDLLSAERWFLNSQPLKAAVSGTPASVWRAADPI